jgi:hypothetical protein
MAQPSAASAMDQTQNISDPSPKLGAHSAADHPEVTPGHASKPPPLPAKRSVTSLKTSSLAGSDSSKPLERKDVIARMLAAKAGKLLPSHTEPSKRTTLSPEVRPDSLKHPEAPISAPSKATDSLSVQPRHQLPAETRVKEKNKAQTELARQRIEQLKKQGLGKIQTRPPPDSGTVLMPVQPLSSSNSPLQSIAPQTLPQPAHSSTLSHPLPDRPPEPEPAPPSRIPGLFMTSSEVPELPEPQSISNHQNQPRETASSKVRVPPRKRPRASDFTDDPIPAPQKRPFGPEIRARSPDQRVIIDISEDEYMYGSDNNDDEGPNPSVIDAGIGPDNRAASRQRIIRDLPPLTDFPSRVAHSYLTSPATSGPQTPGRGREQADLRTKDLEILAMHQRIAELEKRRKEKQAASRVQSPGTSGRSATTSVVEAPTVTSGEEPQKTSAPEDCHPKISSPRTPGVESIVHGEGLEAQHPQIESTTTHVVATNLQSSPSARSSASFDRRKLEEMRQKVLRKMDIESGLPILEAELHKYESKLAQFREKSERLMAEIAKGKAGKRRLVEELDDLGIETAGLSLEEIQAATQRLDEDQGSISNTQGERSLGKI